MSSWVLCTVCRLNRAEGIDRPLTPLAYLEHDIERAIIIDFDLHHGQSVVQLGFVLAADFSGNGTQALVMPLNEASHAEDLAIKAGKPPSGPIGKDGKRRKGWKGFYGSVHDIVSCQSRGMEAPADMNSIVTPARSVTWPNRLYLKIGSADNVGW